MDKEQKIQEHKEKLKEIFKDIPEDKKVLLEGLIDNASFMHVTLEELQKEVNENGAMIQYQSGNGFDTIKDNPAQKAYTTMISRYSAIIDQLNKILTVNKEENVSDELLEFLQEH